MNLFDMLNQAQGGSGLQQLGQQFGLSPQQTQSAVEALLPAFSQGFRQNAADPQGLGSLLTALASGQHAKYAQDATKAFSPQGLAEGNGILGHLFGSKELSRAVAAQASQATGIGQDTLKQMLPALASMLMGSLFKQTNSQVKSGAVAASNPLGEIIEQMMKGGQGGARQAPAQSDNPLGDILGQILGGGQAGKAPQGGGNNPLGDILGQILGGGQGSKAPQGGGNNPLGDILGQILGGGRQPAEPEEEPQAAPQRRQPRQQPQSDNPLGDILGQILGGGQPQAEPDEEPEPQPQRRQPRQQPQAGPSNPLEDIFGKMFNPGGQGEVAQDQNYQQGIDNIFEQFRKGVDRQTR